MTDDASRDAKRLARFYLCAAAERARTRGQSAIDWEASVDDTPEGVLLGAREIDAIGSLVFGSRGKRRVLRG